MRTRGIDNSDVLWRGAFDVWDFAGQAEYYPAHALVASEVRGVSVVMCDASVTKTERERQLRHWLEFVVDRVTPEDRREARRIGLPATVVLIVLTHGDMMNADDVALAVKECSAFVEREFNSEEPFVGLGVEQGSCR